MTVSSLARSAELITYITRSMCSKIARSLFSGISKFMYALGVVGFGCFFVLVYWAKVWAGFYFVSCIDFSTLNSFTLFVS